MTGNINFGVVCTKRSVPLSGVKVIFTLLDYLGNVILPLYTITTISGLDGKCKALFSNVNKGNYKIKAEIQGSATCPNKILFSGVIKIVETITNTSCYRWEIYTEQGLIVASGTVQPSAANPLEIDIDYSSVAPGSYKLKVWDCNKTCDSPLVNLVITDNSLPIGVDPSGWSEIQLI